MDTALLPRFSQLVSAHVWSICLAAEGKRDILPFAKEHLPSSRDWSHQAAQCSGSQHLQNVRRTGLWTFFLLALPTSPGIGLSPEGVIDPEDRGEHVFCMYLEGRSVAPSEFNLGQEVFP